MSVKAIIFDCFGVLYHGVRSYMLAQAGPERRDRINELFDQSDYGLITADDFIVQAAEVLGQTPEALITLLRTKYHRNEQLTARLAPLRQHHKVALLSNVNDSLIDQLFSPDEQTGFFDEVVISSHIGMVKPYPEIYEFTADRLDVLPEECIMIDDLIANIDGARAVGMDGIVFQSTDQCLAELRQRGIEV